MAIDPVSIAALIASAIAALATVASSRTQAQAQRKTAEANREAAIATNKEDNRTQRETEAYDRARRFDTDTISRQDMEIEELRSKNVVLEAKVDDLLETKRVLTDDNRTLHAELRALRHRLARVERGLNPNSEEPIRERESDDYPNAGT